MISVADEHAGCPWCGSPIVWESYEADEETYYGHCQVSPQDHQVYLEGADEPWT